jgi:predicted PurR-regulated permease PerM
MKRSVWKWTFGLSLALLVLLILFAIGIWALGNATAAILGGLMGFMNSDNFRY